MRVRILGPIEVIVDGSTVPVPSGRTTALLAALALAPGRPLSMDALADRVWGEELPADVRGSLATCALRLRRAIGHEAVRSAADGYRLAVGEEDVDAAQFRRLVSRAAVSADETVTLQEALDLWKGAPLQGIRLSPALAAEADALNEERLSAFARFVDLSLDLGRHDDLVPQLTETVAQYPLQERFAAQLMLALYRGGRQAAALDVYTALRQRLVDELGIDPGADVTALHERILRADVPPPSAPLTAPTSVATVGAAVVPAQLPAPLPGLVGREDMLNALDSAVDPSRDGAAPALALLVGAAGIGKTSVAVQWAARARDRYPDGQLYLNLNGFGAGEPLDARRAAAQMLTSLGVGFDRIPDDLESRTALLRTLLADKRALIVLDNARSDEQVRPLLPGGGCAVLVTSRNQLRGLTAREHATRIDVPLLEDGAARSLLSRVAGHEDISDSVLSRLVALCGRLPLALSIAGERINREHDIDPQELLAELVDENAGTDATAQLTTVLSWSYRTLDTERAKVFRCAGLHPSRQFGIDVIAAAIQLPQRAVRRHLDDLAAISLVQSSGSGRFELHDLVQAYARTRAEEIDGPAEIAKIAGRILAWYLQTTKNMRQMLTDRWVRSSLPERSDVDALTFADRDEALAWAALERPTIVACVQYALDTGHLQYAVEIAIIYFQYLYLSGRRDDAELMHRTALSGATHDERDVARLLSGLAVVVAPSRPSEAVEMTERALQIWRGQDDPPGEATLLSNLGLYYQKLDIHRAADCLEQAIAITRSQPDPNPANLGTSLNNLALVRLALGHAADAITLAEEALDLYSRTNNEGATASVLDTLGRSYLIAGQPTSAITQLRKALAVARGFGNRHSDATTSIALGQALAAAGSAEAARPHWEHARRILEQVNDSDRVEQVRLLLAGQDVPVEIAF